MENKLKLLIAVFTVIAISAQVYATTPSGATISGETDYGEYNVLSPGSTNVQSGNISAANLDTNMSTYRWAGLNGNVTGDIVLGDENNETMYTWTATGRGVYASTASSINWSGLENASSTDMPAYLTEGSSDNYTLTFTGSGTIDSGIYSITALRTTTQSAEATTWYTYSLKDDSNNLWFGEVVENGKSYSNSTVDYQIILPEDGTSGDESSTQYYLWVELQ